MNTEQKWYVALAQPPGQIGGGWRVCIVCACEHEPDCSGESGVGTPACLCQCPHCGNTGERILARGLTDEQAETVGSLSRMEDVRAFLNERMLRLTAVRDPRATRAFIERRRAPPAPTPFADI